MIEQNSFDRINGTVRYGTFDFMPLITPPPPAFLSSLQLGNVTDVSKDHDYQ